MSTSMFYRNGGRLLAIMVAGMASIVIGGGQQDMNYLMNCKQQ